MPKSTKLKKKDKSKKIDKTMVESKSTQILSLYSKVLDGIEKDYSLDSSDLHKHKISSGLICTDLVIGGGLSAGWISISGQEASGKSTLSSHAIKESLKIDIPIRQHRDAEGTVEEDYSKNIFNVKDVKSVYGLKSKGEWVIPSLCRYYDTNIMEKTFDSLIKTTNRLPDKIYRKEDDTWYLVLEPRDKRTVAFQQILGEPDRKLKQTTGNLWYPTENPWPQAFVVIDSLPSLISEKSDEAEEKLGGLALNARAFSEFMPRLVGKLRRKNIVIMAINQVREKPMVMYGSPFYEPGGNALRFYSSCRNQIFARATPKEWQSGSKGSSVCVEKSLIGDGFDEYAYKHFKNTKNKLASPYLDTWTRVWISDRNGQGRGFDLAFDGWLGLQQSGLATEIRKQGKKYLQFEKDLPKSLSDLSKKNVEFSDFKALIYGKELRDREYRELHEKTSKKLNINPSLNIHTSLGKLINTGKLSYVPIKKVKDDD
jgi:RecA/RadA recombinase